MKSAFYFKFLMLLCSYTASAQWSLTGNTGTTPGTNFLGTTDAQHLVFKTNGADRVRITSGGNLLVGTTTDNSFLMDVNGTSIFRNNLTVDFNTANRRAQLRDNGLYLTRTTDGVYVSTITANGTMNYDTRDHHRFLNDGVESMVIRNGGDVGIGIAAPTTKLQVAGHVYGTGFKLDGGNSLYWQDLNTHIQRNTSNQLEFQEYTGQFLFKGLANFGMTYSHPTNGEVLFTFPSNQTFALTHKSAQVLQTSALDANNCWIKLGTSQAQYGDGPGANLYLFGGPGGTIGLLNGGNVFIDAGVKGSVSAADGYILLGTQHGKVGIGVAAPTAQLHTNGSVRLSGLSNDNAQTRVIVSDANGNLTYRDVSTIGGSSLVWQYGGNGVGSETAIGTTSNQALPLITNGIERMRIGTNGNIGIGTFNITDLAFKLYVETGIRTRKVRVDPGTWTDYVFQPGYYLRPLAEVEQYIKDNSHLPDIPSAKEVSEEGIDLGDNQAALLKKIEELTLYIIEQQKQLKEQQKRIEMLEKNSGHVLKAKNGNSSTPGQR